MKFTELQMDSRLLKALEKMGYTECTAVQEKVLRDTREESDLYVQSKTGTGKTAAYLLAISQSLLANYVEKNFNRSLILVPTRELAVQVEEECRAILAETPIKCAAFYGGVGYEKQLEAIKKGISIIIGTPGRIIDLNENADKNGATLDLSRVKYLVIDEADRMFDMGFYPDLRKLLKVLPKNEERTTMLFSATLNSYVKNLAWEYTVNAKEIEIASENITVDKIAQKLIHVSSEDKIRLLLGVLRKKNAKSAIIFCNTKKSAEIVAKRLKINGINAGFIIGDLAQKRRLEILKSFKEKKLSVLVATDVAARGIDVDDLELVINYDLPNEAENYVHRIGRTARAGKSGEACTFVSERDVYDLPAIERYVNMKIPQIVANDESFSEDKSKNVYIKLESEETEKKFETRNYSRRERETDKKNTRKKKNSIAEKINKNADFKELENLSFEERLEIYKKRYLSPHEQKGKKVAFKKISTKNAKKQKNFKQKQKNASRYINDKSTAIKAQKNILGKKNFFSSLIQRISDIFSK